MEMKKTARTALLSALFTVLLAPGAFAEKSLSMNTHWMRIGLVIMRPGKPSGQK